MSIIEVLVVLGAGMIGLLIGCLIYQRRKADKELDILLSKAIDEAIRRDRDKSNYSPPPGSGPPTSH